MNLDPSRNAQHQLTAADLITDITRGTVTARKQQQIYAGFLQGRGAAFGIFGTGLVRLAQLTDHLMRKAQFGKQIAPHGARGGKQLQLIAQRQQQL